MIFHLNMKLREEITGYEDERSVEKLQTSLKYCTLF